MMTSLFFSSFPPIIQIILTLIAIDVALGITAAVRTKEFRLAKVAGFMKKAVLPYVFGSIILFVTTEEIRSFTLFIAAQIAELLIILALTGSILNNVAKFGIKIPALLKKD